MHFLNSCGDYAKEAIISCAYSFTYKRCRNLQLSNFAKRERESKLKIEKHGNEKNMQTSEASLCIEARKTSQYFVESCNLDRRTSFLKLLLTEICSFIIVLKFKYFSCINQTHHQDEHKNISYFCKYMKENHIFH
jgi:hypothetical protein